MTPFIVTLADDTEYRFMADDAEHAREQAENAEPDALITSVTPESEGQDRESYSDDQDRESYSDDPDAPIVIDFVVDTSALNTGDIEVIEDALRTLLLEGDGVLSSEYKGAIIATLRKVEKVLRHPAVVLVGGNVPVHVPGSYPTLRCCGGQITLVQS